MDPCRTDRSATVFMVGNIRFSSASVSRPRRTTPKVTSRDRVLVARTADQQAWPRTCNASECCLQNDLISLRETTDVLSIRFIASPFEAPKLALAGKTVGDAPAKNPDQNLSAPGVEEVITLLRNCEYGSRAMGRPKYADWTSL